MNAPAVPRRTFIGWVVTSLIVSPNSATATINTSWQADAPLHKRSDWLFAGRVPAQARQVVTRFAFGVYASVYELRIGEGRDGWSIQRWLCIASAGEPGKFAIQTSGDALCASTNWHPTDVDVNVLKGGDVEVDEGLLRGRSTTQWGRSGSNWELLAIRSTGVSANRFYDHEYDREKRELVVRTGDPGDSDVDLATERYAVAETFTLADFGRKPLVNFV